MKTSTQYICLFAICCCFNITAKSYSENVYEEWSIRFNESVSDTLYDMKMDGGGNMYLTGSTVRSGTGKDILTMKILSSGVIEWKKYYNGSLNQNDFGRAITYDADGNVFVTSRSNNNRDIVTIKYNSLGDVLWVSTFSGPVNSLNGSNDIIVDKLGNVYITGYHEPLQNPNTEMILIKYDSLGVEQWVSYYNGYKGQKFDEGKKIGIDKSYNIYAAVWSQINPIGGLDANVILKYNSNGNLIWEVKYEGNPGHDGGIPKDLAVDEIGNSYVISATYGNDTSRIDILLQKYDSAGNSLWRKFYDAGNPVPPYYTFDTPNDLLLTQQNDLFIAGSSQNTLNGRMDYISLRYNFDGALQWVSRYDNGIYNSNDDAIALTTDRQGNIYVTGQSDSGTLIYDCVTIKYDANGIQQWKKKFGVNFFNETGQFIRTDSTGSIYVAGYAQGSGSDIFIVKYSPLIGINQVSSEIPTHYRLQQNYPNPFNPSTQIKFNLPQNTFVTIKVFNALGQVVAVLLNNEYKDAGSYSAMFDGTNFASGIYFYSIEAGTYKDIKKMVLIK